MRRLLYLLAATIALVLVPASSIGAQTPVVVAVDDSDIEEDATVEIPITAQGAAGIIALHVEITYDPAALEWDRLENGSLLSSNSLVEVNPDQPGRVIIGIATLDEIDGTGPVLRPMFRVVGTEGDTTIVGLENVAAWDENGFDILIQTQDAELVIAGSSGGFPLWVIVLIVVVVIAIYLWNRRQQSARPDAGPVAAAPPPPPPPPPPPGG